MLITIIVHTYYKTNQLDFLFIHYDMIFQFHTHLLSHLQYLIHTLSRRMYVKPNAL